MTAPITARPPGAQKVGLILFAGPNDLGMSVRRNGCSYPDRFSCMRKWRQPLSSMRTRLHLLQAIMMPVIDEQQPTTAEVRSHQYGASLYYHEFRSLPRCQYKSLAGDGPDAV